MNITKKQSDRLSKFLSACGGMIKRPPLTKLYYKRLNNRVWYDLKIFKKKNPHGAISGAGEGTGQHNLKCGLNPKT